MLNLNKVIIKSGDSLVSQITQTSVTLDLTKEETETILLMLKESHFKGEHVEKIYVLACKLQQYYSGL